MPHRLPMLQPPRGEKDGPPPPPPPPPPPHPPPTLTPYNHLTERKSPTPHPHPSTPHPLTEKGRKSDGKRQKHGQTDRERWTGNQARKLADK